MNNFFSFSILYSLLCKPGFDLWSFWGGERLSSCAQLMRDLGLWCGRPQICHDRHGYTKDILKIHNERRICHKSLDFMIKVCFMEIMEESDAEW